jgi:hypothetical protein
MFGIAINAIDRLADKKQELELEIMDLAIKEIKENKELRDVIVRAKAFEIMNMKDPELEPKPPPTPKPDPFDDIIAKAKKEKELKEVLGIKEPSFWGELAGNPLILPAIIGIFGAVLANLANNKTSGGGNADGSNLGIQLQKVSQAMFEAVSRLAPKSDTGQPRKTPSSPGVAGNGIKPRSPGNGVKEAKAIQPPNDGKASSASDSV